MGPEGISSDWKRRVEGSRRERKREGKTGKGRGKKRGTGEGVTGGNME